MKKFYEAPSVELVKFQYRDQVVAASGAGGCSKEWVNIGIESCQSGNEFYEWHGNQA